MPSSSRAVTKYTECEGCHLPDGPVWATWCVWACQERKTYGYKKVTFGKDREVTIALDRDDDAVSSVDMAIVPPKESPNVTEVSAEQVRTFCCRG